MPAYRLPGSYKARKRLKLLDATYEPGDTIPVTVIRQVKRLSALVSSRAIVPDKDPHHRRTKAERSTPTDFSARVRKGL